MIQELSQGGLTLYTGLVYMTKTEPHTHVLWYGLLGLDNRDDNKCYIRDVRYNEEEC